MHGPTFAFALPVRILIASSPRRCLPLAWSLCNTLQKCNSAMYAQSLTAVSRELGSNFIPGYDVPVEDF